VMPTHVSRCSGAEVRPMTTAAAAVSTHTGRTLRNCHVTLRLYGHRRLTPRTLEDYWRSC
jgi:hypothetical protein